MLKKSFIMLALAILFLAGCSRFTKEYYQISGAAQGTYYQITYEDNKGRDHSAAIDSLLKVFDRSFSLYDSTSLISRINRNEAVVANDWFVEVFKKSLEINQQSGGAFDITVGPVIRAWGFSSGPVAKHDSAHIDSLLQFVGMEKVGLEGRKVVKEFPGVQLDMNALAQGYSVDILCDFFEKKGIRNYLVEIGGEVRGKGRNSKSLPWQIGIEKPVEGSPMDGREVQIVIGIDDKAVATSGNYRKFYVEDGIKYSHIIDPKTGRPARNTLLSTTVVAPDCMTADALATTFMVLGVENSKRLLENLPGIEVFFIYADNTGEYQTYSSEGLEKLITNTEP